MNRSLRSSFLAIVMLSAAAPLAGCVVTSDDNSITLESTVLFTAPPESGSVAYTPGKAVRIVGVNGDISVGQSSSGDLRYTFEAFTREKEENEDQAVRQMQDDLHLEVTEDPTSIIVAVKVDSGSSSFLGAHIRVDLPSSFDGAFVLDQGNGTVSADLRGSTPASTHAVNTGAGDVKVVGARGAINVSGTFDIDVDVASWGTGTVTSTGGLGDLIFRLPADLDGTMSAQTDGTLTEPSPLPASWQVAESSPSSKSYTMGAGGENIDLRAGGSITIQVK